MQSVAGSDDALALGHQVLSRISVVVPFDFTDSMPLSLADVDEYISLLPITSPFDAFNTK